MLPILKTCFCKFYKNLQGFFLRTEKIFTYCLQDSDMQNSKTDRIRSKEEYICSERVGHRSRINTEEKAKVVPSVWQTEFI